MKFVFTKNEKLKNKENNVGKKRALRYRKKIGRDKRIITRGKETQIRNKKEKKMRRRKKYRNYKYEKRKSEKKQKNSNETKTKKKQ